MSRIILIQYDDYERQYLESKEYLNSVFHDHPTRLRDIPGDDDPMYNWITPHRRQQNRPTPNGKRVI